MYCDFYSLSNQNEELQKDYTDALVSHIKILSEKHSATTVDTVFIGGGTPTVLKTEFFKKILKSLKNNFKTEPDAEFTVEANPASFNLDKLKLYSEYGINRLSIGLQSADNRELELLGRIHSYEDFCRSFETARQAGFKNISVDLMYGIPSQTSESLSKTLSKVIKLSPEHISLYGLQLEENTPLYAKKDFYRFADEDEEIAMNFSACDTLEKYGYKRYEISNYSKQGFECRHNLRYWKGLEYIGLGPSAHSFVNRVRYGYKDDIYAYMKSVRENNFGEITESTEVLSDSEKISEYIMLKLRLAEGISRDDFEKTLGADFTLYENKMKQFIKTGHMKTDGNSFYLTREGFYISNYIIAEII